MRTEAVDRSMQYLDRPVTLAGDLKTNTRAAWVQRDPTMLGDDHSTRNPLLLEYSSIRKWEEMLAGDREKASIQRALKVAIIRRDGIVHSDEIGASRKSALDHELSESSDDGWLDVAATEKRLANGHELCNAMVAIAHQLSELTLDTWMMRRGG